VTAAVSHGSLPEAPFEAQNFARSLDVQRYLDACPPGATTRGTFFLHVLAHVQEVLGQDPEPLYRGVPRRSWHAFKEYPLGEFMNLAHNAARLLHPKAPLPEALRRVGWLSFTSFAATMSGRVVLFALGERVNDVFRACPAAYRLTLPAAIVRVSQVSERHFRLEMRNVHSFVDTYHFGVIEGAFKAFGLKAAILVRQHPRLSDADFDVSW
jgi:uncharacterized protein (TIGR02265 family)